MSSIHDLRQGARFVKATGFDRSVWIVEALLDRPGCPSHARLAREGVRGDTLTVSTAILADPDRFRARVAECRP